MKTTEEQVIMVCRQAELESQLSRLYTIYDHKFPLTKIWPMLIGEEKKHESWLMQMIPKIEDGTIYFYRDDITVQNIDDMIGNIEKEIIRAENSAVSLKTAVATALDFEDSVLEKNIFSYFDSEYPAIEDILDKLKDDTQRHRAMLSQAVESLKKKMKI